MILYKYVDLCTGMKIIRNHTVRFTHPYDLNDPFELRASFYNYDNSDGGQYDDLMRYHMFSSTYGILSLSRAPLNPLMWSHYSRGKRHVKSKGIHYGENNMAHGGLVIGIDSEQAGFDDQARNLIPAKFGSVIYTSTKPVGKFTNSQANEFLEGRLSSYRFDYLEALQRVFLYKSMSWAYEEEVRVVRNIERTHLTEIQVIEIDSIKEIYIGQIHGEPQESAEIIYGEIKKYLPHCKVLLCKTEEASWDLGATAFE